MTFQAGGFPGPSGAWDCSHGWSAAEPVVRGHVACLAPAGRRRTLVGTCHRLLRPVRGGRDVAFSPRVSSRLVPGLHPWLCSCALFEGESAVRREGHAPQAASCTRRETGLSRSGLAIDFGLAVTHIFRCPVGASDSSPAIYRWDHGLGRQPSPAGTTEPSGLQSSLRDWVRWRSIRSQR